VNNSRKFAYGKPGLFRALGTIIPIAIISILTSNASLAQIIPDTTLGNQNSRVMSGVNIKGNGADLIEGGVQSGTNLFHSFAEFNVNNGQRVYFANPTGIANILSRVTGNNPSNIFGTLGVNGAANLFLLNPNGIIFGLNAQLDIQGSFLATTANSFQFPDGGEFSATNPQAPPLLTMSVPVGVQFGSQPTASITNQGNLVTGKDLTLNAGNLDLQGTLQAGGNISLNSQKGKIDINADIISKTPNGIAGNVTIKAVGDINIFKTIEASSNNEEKTYNNITINSTEGSVYLNGSNLNTNNSGSGYAGDIIINASDQISILNGSKITSQGNYGFIDIKTGSLSLNDKSEINTDNKNGSEDAGFISIDARDEISILNGSKITSQGNYGFIDIKTGSLSLNDKSEINTDSDSGYTGFIILNVSDQKPTSSNKTKVNNDTRNAGAIIINAKDQISILNGSKITSQGNYGFIDITTQNLLLRRQSKISTTVGKQALGGNAGNITINAKDGFVIAVPSEDSDIIANAFGGQGGKIDIYTNLTLGFQNRGKLTSEKLKTIENNGSSDISASSDVGAEGKVTIETLSTDPSQGLVALPIQLVDPSRLIAQGCDRNSNVAKGQSEFVITGRGGLPPSPDDTLKPGVTLPEWVVNNTVNNGNYSENMTERNLRQLSSNISTPLVEAVGMVRSANGDIVLTAQTATLLQSGLSTQACNVTQGNVR